MTGVLVASDLDRTLIYSASALRLPGPDEAAPPMAVVEVYQGAPLSFMTEAARDALTAVAAHTVFVPVTTRTRAQYDRVRVPRSADDWAVTTNGAVVLHGGAVDEDWARTIARRTAAESAALPEVRAMLAAGGDQVLRVRDAEGVFVYAIVDRAVLADTFVDDLTARCRAVGWRVSLQGRKLYCVPDAVRKAEAVTAIAERLGAERVVAAGDSLLDQEMLERADVALRPAHGELEDAGFRAPHCTVTAVDGVLAGQEIAERMLALVHEGARSRDGHEASRVAGSPAAM